MVAAAIGALDDPDVTGMEIATACLDGGSYSSIEIVLGYRYYPALVVQVGTSEERNLERCPLSDDICSPNLGDAGAPRWLATIPKVPASSANTKTQRIGMSVTSTHG